jgi:hypothetical protein
MEPTPVIKNTGATASRIAWETVGISAIATMKICSKLIMPAIVQKTGKFG